MKTKWAKWWPSQWVIQVPYLERSFIEMFRLTPLQIKSLNDWIESQEKVHEGSVGAIGGRYSYSFTPTNLGVVSVVTDNFTKTSIDLTGYNEW